MITRHLWIGLAAVSFTAAISVRACIWNGDTLLGERLGRPAISALIFNDLEPLRDAPKYREKLKALLAEPKPADPRWINEAAGAYLRSGDPQKAVELLEPALERFPSEYGVHANLGTAYHLLGRYTDAERHIARDLELNPDAHFGLEKYHLALLQYLVRDDSWKRERVYVDEYSYSLQRAGGGRLFVRDAVNSPPMAASEQRVRLPAYRQHWNLAKDEKRVEGIQYMAELNPREPATFEMLGVICWARGGPQSRRRGLREGHPPRFPQVGTLASEVGPDSPTRSGGAVDVSAVCRAWRRGDRLGVAVPRPIPAKVGVISIAAAMDAIEAPAVTSYPAG